MRNDAHRLIEEAMISANVCAARFLEKHEALALYRIHEGPTPEKFDLLRQALAHAGIRLDDAAADADDCLRRSRRSWSIGRIAGCSRR